LTKLGAVSKDWRKSNSLPVDLRVSAKKVYNWLCSFVEGWRAEKIPFIKLQNEY
jgi:hypothetical protein